MSSDNPMFSLKKLDSLVSASKNNDNDFDNINDTNEITSRSHIKYAKGRGKLSMKKNNVKKGYSFEDLYKKYTEVLPENYNQLVVKDYIRWITSNGEVSDGYTIISTDNKKFKIKGKNGEFIFDPALFNKIYKFNRVTAVKNTGIITPDGIIIDAPQNNSHNNLQNVLQGGSLQNVLQGGSLQNSSQSNSYNNSQSSSQGHSNYTKEQNDNLVQIGNKLLFDESHSIKLEINEINSKIKKIEGDIKNMFILLKRVCNKVQIT